MTKREEFEIMKTNPKQLYDYYVDLLMSGVVLDQDQVVKLEYCKKVLDGGI